MHCNHFLLWAEEAISECQTASNPQEAHVQSYPFTLLQMKKTSSAKAKRYEKHVKFLNTEFCWDQFLSELHVVSQDTLLLNYVLEVSIDKVCNFMYPHIKPIY